MLDTISQVRGTIEVLENALQVSAADTANSETTGYKDLTLNFQTVFNRLISPGSPTGSFRTLGGKNPIQFGGGLGIASTALNFTQGELEGAGLLSLAVVGNGLFIVSPDNGQTQLYTRNGNFSLDGDGFLVNDRGMQVYGFRTDSNGNRVSSTAEPIRLTGLTQPGVDDNGLFGEATTSTDESGETVITVTGSQYQIALTHFANPGALEILSGTLYRESLASGPASTPSAPGLNTAVGQVAGGKLELSNVFFVGETINQTNLQQAFEANITVIQTINNIIESTINRLAG